MVNSKLECINLKKTETTYWVSALTHLLMDLDQKKTYDAITQRQQLVDNANSLNKKQYEYMGCKIIVRQNNIINEPTDGIVNPANSKLTNGAGAAKAIQDAAGQDYISECEQYLQDYKKLPTGEAMTTTGGKLPCKYVINVVGPKCMENQEDISKKSRLLKAALCSVLNEMVEYEMESISILAISTGLYRFPLETCVQIYARNIKKFIEKAKGEMEGKTIVLCKAVA